MTGPKKGSRGRAPKRMTAQGRGGATRDTTRPVRERTPREEGRPESRGQEGRGQDQRTESSRRGEGARTTTRTGTRTNTGARGGTAASRGGDTNPARRRSGEGGERGSTGGERPFGPGPARKAPPRVVKKKPLPELKRVQLDAPPADTVFTDRDGERLTFPDSNLKRVAAQLLTEKNKAWRYRAFSFPLFTERGSEQTFYFDFYIYDAEDSVIRLLLVVPFESREVWDRVGRFKRQYPMYTYELWTPERLAQLGRPRAQLGF